MNKECKEAFKAAGMVKFYETFAAGWEARDKTLDAIFESEIELIAPDQRAPFYAFWDDMKKRANAVECSGERPAAAIDASADAFDAARYRWLRDNGRCDGKRSGVVIGVPLSATLSFRYWVAPPSLDVLIDAAMLDWRPACNCEFLKKDDLL